MGLKRLFQTDQSTLSKLYFFLQSYICVVLVLLFRHQLETGLLWKGSMCKITYLLDHCRIQWNSGQGCPIFMWVETSLLELFQMALGSGQKCNMCVFVCLHIITDSTIGALTGIIQFILCSQFFVYDNSFTGSIPTWIGQLTRLTLLYVGATSISRVILQSAECVLLTFFDQFCSYIKTSSRALYQIALASCRCLLR